MPALQVRDLPQEIYEKLYQSARAEHRSIAQQATHILETHFKVIEGGRSQQTRPRRNSYGPDLATPEEIEARIERRKRAIERLEELSNGISWPDDGTCERLYLEAREERDARPGL